MVKISNEKGLFIHIVMEMIFKKYKKIPCMLIHLKKLIKRVTGTKQPEVGAKDKQS